MCCVQVAYSLDVPWYASLPRVETRFYIDQYGGESDVWIGKTLYRYFSLSSPYNVSLILPFFFISQTNTDHLFIQNRSRYVNLLLHVLLRDTLSINSCIAYSKVSYTILRINFIVIIVRKKIIKDDIINYTFQDNLWKKN